MNKATNILIPGAAFGGGFYSHTLRIGENGFGIIVAPKAGGQFRPVAWSKSTKRVPGALSYVDGLANTRAMAEAGSPIAQKALATRIGDFDDWFIPARDQLEPAYRVLKPGDGKNYCYFRSGENPTIGTHPYTAGSPAQTEVEAFRAGGREAFDLDYYLTSTQFEPYDDSAWIQDFNNGCQGTSHKSLHRPVRLVRMIKL